MSNPVPPTPRSDIDTTATTDTVRTGTHPRASETAAPAPEDAIVSAADGDSDYAHSDMAEAVDEAQGKVGSDPVVRDTVRRP